MHMRALAAAVAALFLLVPAPTPCYAQGNRVVAVEDWAYRYVERLQRRGYMTDLNPTDFPYREGEIAASLDRLDTTELGKMERYWFDMLVERFQSPSAGASDAVVGGSFTARLDAADSERLDPLRPLGSDPHAYQAGLVQFFAESGRWIAHFGMRHDWYYHRDPDAIDTANRLFIRSEDAYAGYRGRLVTAYAGRYHSHWAPLSDDALFVSSNPRSFDAIDFRFGGRKVAMRAVYGELDSITGDGRYTGAAGADSVTAGSEKRFLVSHRLDWRPSRHVQITALESTLFSGPNTSLSLKMLNPAHAWGFESDNKPKNDENNGLLGGLVWLNFGRLTIHGQMLMDDLDLQGQSGEPWSYALSGSVVYGGLTPRLDAGVRLTVVAARTFNADQLEGQYIYVNRGLATQWSDYVHGRVFGDIYLEDLIPGLTLSPRIELLSQGEADMRDPFPQDDVDEILVGTPEHTFRGAVAVFYQPSKYWWAAVDAGVNHVRNAGHADGITDTRFSGMVSVGARISITRAVGLWD
jgi:hypothetical protein